MPMASAAGAGSGGHGYRRPMDGVGAGEAPGGGELRLGPLVFAEHRDGLEALYVAVFAEPPWNEGPEAGGAFTTRLETEVAAGARGLVLLDGPSVRGMAYAVPTPAPFPHGRSYDRVARVCDARRFEGTWEVMEVAVHPAARGGGWATALLSALLEECSPAWLLTSEDAAAARRLYEGHPGLRRVGMGEGLVVYATT